MSMTPAQAFRIVVAGPNPFNISEYLSANDVLWDMKREIREKNPDLGGEAISRMFTQQLAQLAAVPLGPLPTPEPAPRKSREDRKRELEERGNDAFLVAQKLKAEGYEAVDPEFEAFKAKLAKETDDVG